MAVTGQTRSRLVIALASPESGKEISDLLDNGVHGTLVTTGNGTIGGNLAVTGNETVGGTLGVTGTLNALGALAVTGNQTIGGTLNVTGDTTFAGKTKGSTANALTAHAGGGQASALALTAKINRVTTVGTAADSVKLPPATAGDTITVINAAAANAMAIFPASGEVINALSADASISVAANKVIHFFCAVAGTWNSILTA